jgi:hypothetical protein
MGVRSRDLLAAQLFLLAQRAPKQWLLLLGLEEFSVMDGYAMRGGLMTAAFSPRAVQFWEQIGVMLAAARLKYRQALRFGQVGVQHLQVLDASDACGVTLPEKNGLDLGEGQTASRAIFSATRARRANVESNCTSSLLNSRGSCV